MAKNATDNWQTRKIFTDNWHFKHSLTTDFFSFVSEKPCKMSIKWLKTPIRWRIFCMNNYFGVNLCLFAWERLEYHDHQYNYGLCWYDHEFGPSKTKLYHILLTKPLLYWQLTKSQIFYWQLILEPPHYHPHLRPGEIDDPYWDLDFTSNLLLFSFGGKLNT